ncbi:MAG: 2-C-methyl-D-erythritol 4-phosphate cytidylyltransferase, partial [Bacteroidetes bacterium]
MKLGAVIVAGGSGTRMGSEIPKQFLPLSGVPVLAHTLWRFLSYSPDLQVVLVLPAAQIARWEVLADAHIDSAERSRIVLCEGGATRTLSVGYGLRCLAALAGSPAEMLVAIHDGVRPLVSAALIRA